MSDKQKNQKPEPIAAQSPDLRAELRDQLRSLVPEAFAEGKLDTDKLKALLGENGDAGAERYSFSWAGKRDAIAMLQVPTRATLIPDRENSVNFDEAGHVFIEGENLEVLKVLYRSYFGRVKMIYIDPPYNTGNDFIYPDDFADPLDHYLRITGQKNGNGDYTTSQVDKNGRIHSAWLSMMYPRLALARQLLREDGVVFISIDDFEVDNLKKLLDEIFGEENFIAAFIWKRKAGGGDDSEHVAAEHEYIICFARNSEHAGIASVLHESPAMTAKYNRTESGKRYYLERLDKTSLTYSTSMDFPIECPDGTFVSPPQPDPKKPTTAWRWGKKTAATRRDELIFERDKKTNEWRIYTKTWEPKDGVTPRTLLTEKEHGRNRDGTQELTSILGPKVFSNPKPTKLLRHLLNMGARDMDALVVDFFAGSGSLAHALIQMNKSDGGSRESISVQLPELTGREDFKTIADICRKRLQCALAQMDESGHDADKGKLKLNEPQKGLRSFKLSNSNLRRWTGVGEMGADSFTTQIEAFADMLVLGWKPENVIWEIALREGYSLTSRIEKLTKTGKQAFWRVTDPDREQSFVICLDDTLTLDAVRALKLHKDSLFICRDTALDDTLSANLALQCRLKVL